MPVFKKSVVLPASVAEVFRFHCNPANLEHVQPPGAKVIESELPEQLELGSICSMTVKVPFGVQQWKIVVDELELSEDGDRAMLVDRAIISPFDRWVHRHGFVRHEDGTLMQDEVEFQPPGGSFSLLLLGPTYLLLMGLFLFRHHRTKAYFAHQSGGVL